MKVIVFYESRSGNTELAARHIGGVCESLGVDTSVRSVRSGDYSGIAEADLIFLGTWIWGAATIGSMLVTAPKWLSLIFFVVAGIGWAVPLKPVFNWMNSVPED